MRVYATELICITGVFRFQTFKPVFCVYKLKFKLVSKWRHFLQIQLSEVLSLSFKRE